jgi:hypothetical protein
MRKGVFMKITSWFLPAAAGALAAVMTVPAFAQANDGLVPLGTTTVKPLGAVPGGTLVLPTSSLPKPAGQARTHLQFETGAPQPSRRRNGLQQTRNQKIQLAQRCI